MQRWTGCCFVLKRAAGGGKLQQYGQIFKNIIQKTGNIINYELKLNKIQNRPGSVHTFLIEKILIFYYKYVTLLFVCIVQEDGKQ